MTPSDTEPDETAFGDNPVNVMKIAELNFNDFSNLDVDGLMRSGRMAEVVQGMSGRCFTIC
jgi:hypothetical protein